MPRGRPAKKKRNISGLKNQPPPAPEPLPTITESVAEHVTSVLPDISARATEDGDEDEDQLHPGMKDLASSEQEDESDSDFESDEGWKGLTSKDLGKRLAALSCEIDEDEKDLDWIPKNIRPKKCKCFRVQSNVSPF